MITTDSHIHTAFSSDSKTCMEDMVKQGIKLGLTSMCFTDHMDYGFPSKYKLPFVFDPQKYIDEIHHLQIKYQDNITILCGVELGLKSDQYEQINELLNTYTFDFVIGSLHLYHDMDPYYEEFWDSFSQPLDAVKAYLEETLKLMELIDGYQTLGHLDYVLRYAPTAPSHSLYEDIPDLIDSILLQIINKQISMEINTSGYNKIGAPNPDMTILKRYYDLGGQNITIGSDAHVTENLGQHFSKVQEEIKKCGFTEYNYYIQKKPHKIKL